MLCSNKKLILVKKCNVNSLNYIFDQGTAETLALD